MWKETAAATAKGYNRLFRSAKTSHQVSPREVEHPVFNEVAQPVLPPRPLGRVEVERPRLGQAAVGRGRHLGPAKLFVPGKKRLL